MEQIYIKKNYKHIKKAKALFVITLIAASLLIQCMEDDGFDVSLTDVETTTISDIKLYSAKSGGTIALDSGVFVEKCGVCWMKENRNPTIDDNKTKNEAEEGTFTAELTNLQQATTYYVRAYVIDNTGVAYGNELKFVTREILPTAHTIEASDVMLHTAEIVCDAVMDENTPKEVAYGLCWSISQNPTIFDNKTEDKIDIGNFVDTLPDLEQDQVYYVRAYADRGSSTTYSNQISFKTASTITSHRTGLIWMNRNLGASQVATSRYDAASFGSLYQWGRATDGHEKRDLDTLSFHSGDVNGYATTSVPNKDYSWDGKFITSVEDWLLLKDDDLWQGVNGANNPCPEGFRIPTKEEFEAEISTWEKGNNEDAFEFLKLPAAGFRGSFDGLIQPGMGTYWCSTTDGDKAATLDFTDVPESATLNIWRRSCGESIRCIKN